MQILSLNLFLNNFLYSSFLKFRLILFVYPDVLDVHSVCLVPRFSAKFYSEFWDYWLMIFGPKLLFLYPFHLIVITKNKSSLCNTNRFFLAIEF